MKVCGNKLPVLHTCQQRKPPLNYRMQTTWFVANRP